MTKRSVAAYKPVGLRLDDYTVVEGKRRLAKRNPAYDTRAIAAIAAEVREPVPHGRRATLGRELDAAGRWFLAMEEQEALPTPRMMAEHYREIEAAAQRLLDLLEYDDWGDEREPAPPPPIWLVRDDVWSISSEIWGTARLRDWLSAQRQRYAAEPATARHERHGGQAALDDFVRDLIGIYRTVWEKASGTAVLPSGEAGGPMLRFIRKAIELLPGKRALPSPKALRARVRRLSSKKN